MKSDKSRKAADSSTRSPNKASKKSESPVANVDTGKERDTAGTDKSLAKSKSKTLKSRKPTTKTELIKRVESAPPNSSVLEEMLRSEVELDNGHDMKEDILQRLLSQLSENLTRLSIWGNGHFRECGAANKAALKTKKSLKSSKSNNAAAGILRKTSVTEKRWETEFLTILRDSQGSLQLLSSQAAMVLDAQDAEIQKLKAQILRMQHRGSIFHSQFDDPHARHKAAEGGPESVFLSRVMSTPHEAPNSMTHLPGGTSIILEGEDPTALGSGVLPDSQGDCAAPAGAAPLVPGLALPTANPINDQLDSLLQRVHSLLKNTGALTQRGSQILDESPINNFVPTANTASSAVAGDGTHNKNVVADEVDEVDHPKSQISNHSRKGGEELHITADDSEEAVAALKAQTDRIKVEVMALSKTAYQMCRQFTNNFESGIENELERRVSVEDMKLRQCFLEEMQQGSWFFRIGRKFGAFGKALNSMFFKRCYVWVSNDFRDLYCAPNEPLHDQGANTGVGTGTEVLPKDLIVALPLHNVIGFAYGDASRAYRLQESRANAFQPPHLCLSIWTKRQSLDLIALNEQEIERWYLGLNSLLPLFPGRNFMTANEFNIAMDRLRSEFYERDASSSEEQQGDEPTNTVGVPSLHYAQMMYYQADSEDLPGASAQQIPTAEL